jgi:poly(A) polymerase
MIGALSAERVRDEMLKILVSPDPGRVLRQMAASGVLAHAMPGPLEIERMTRVALLEDEQLFVSDALMRLGALMPDQADAREAAIQRLKLSNDEKARLRAMAGREPKIVSYLSIREVRRALYRIGVQAFKDRAMLGWAGDPKPGNAPQWRALRALAESWVRPEMDLDGHEIMAAGVPPGPEVGRVRAEVEDWWIDTDFTDDKFSIIERLKAVVQATVY